MDTPDGSPEKLENPPSNEANLTDSGEGRSLLQSSIDVGSAANKNSRVNTILNRPRSYSLSENAFNAHKANWITKVNKKRLRNSPNDHNQNRINKQLKINKYWLAAPTLTKNRFESLDNTSNDIADSPVQVKLCKLPPIFVDGVSKIQPLTQLLKDTAENDYDLKVLSNEQVKIQLKTDTEYTNIVKLLQSKGTEFHTYRSKQERSFRVVIKNIHYSTNTENIKHAIEELDHTPVNIWNIKQRGTKNLHDRPKIKYKQ